MSDDVLTIKGIKEGLLISISPTEEWQSITAELAARLDEKSSFFQGARIILSTGERPVPKYELSSLKALLERRGMTLTVVQSESYTTIESALALDLRTMAFAQSDPNAERNPDDTLPISPIESGTEGVLIRRTLRSGRLVRSSGHAIIYGDVNPGAQVIAAGDVFVWGKLRGTVHAGAEGDATAMVCALEMNPNQLRIAGFIATSPPQEKRRTIITPEVAFVRNDQIVVEAWGPSSEERT